MEHNKTGSSEDNFKAFISWAKGVRKRLRLRERGGLLIKKGGTGKNEEKNETDVHNN